MRPYASGIAKLRDRGRSLLQEHFPVIAAIGGATLVVTVGFTALQKLTYEGGFVLQVGPADEDESARTLTSQLSQRGKAPLYYDMDTVLQILKSPMVLDAVIEDVRSSLPDLSVAELSNNIQFGQVGKSKLLYVNYRSSHSASIPLITQTLAKHYLDFSKNYPRTQAQRTIAFLDNRIAELNTQLNQVEQQFYAVRKAYNFVDLDSQISTVQTTQQELRQAAQELRLAQAKLQTALNDLEAGNTVTIQAIETSADAASRDIDLKIASAATRFAANSQEIQRLRAIQNNLIPLRQQQIQEAIALQKAQLQIQLTQLNARQQALQTTAQAQQQQSQALPVQIRLYTQLEQAHSTTLKLLAGLRQVRSSLELDGAIETEEWQLHTTPFWSPRPVSPNWPRNLLIGALTGLGLGFGCALLLEKMRPIYSSVEELTQRLPWPLLGKVPQLPHLSASAQFDPADLLAAVTALASSSTPDSPALDPLQEIMVNLQRLDSDMRLRSLTVTAAMPGDGKSTIAMHLAIAAASVGYRVLLVDADLRKPQVHRRWNLSNEQGLSTLLTSDHDPLTVIQHTAEISVITAGPLPPDPLRLLTSNRMQQLAKTLQRSYDLVIYDTPPVAGLADSLNIAAHTHGVLLVARIRHTRRDALQAAVHSLQTAHVPILGIVANGVETSETDYTPLMTDYTPSAVPAETATASRSRS